MNRRSIIELALWSLLTALLVTCGGIAYGILPTPESFVGAGTFAAAWVAAVTFGMLRARRLGAAEGLGVPPTTIRRLPSLKDESSDPGTGLVRCFDAALGLPAREHMPWDAGAPTERAPARVAWQALHLLTRRTQMVMIFGIGLVALIPKGVDDSLQLAPMAMVLPGGLFFLVAWDMRELARWYRGHFDHPARKPSPQTTLPSKAVAPEITA